MNLNSDKPMKDLQQMIHLLYFLAGLGFVTIAWLNGYWFGSEMVYDEAMKSAAQAILTGCQFNE